MKKLVLLAVIFLTLLKVANPRTFLRLEVSLRRVPTGDECVVVARCTTDRGRRIWWRLGDDNEVPAESVNYPEGEDFVASNRRFIVNERKTITCIGVDEVGNDDPERETLTVDPSEGCVIAPHTTLYGAPSSSPDPTPSSSPNPTPSSSPNPTPSSSPDPTPSFSPNPTPSFSPNPTPSSSPNPTPSSSLCGTGCIAGIVIGFILLGAVGLVAVVYIRGDSSASKNSAPVEQPAPEESCDATQDDIRIPPPPPPPPVTETPLSPPASSQKYPYSTCSIQVQEILEAQYKKIRNPASVSNPTCQLESTGSTGGGPESQLSEMKQFSESPCVESSDSQTTSGGKPVFVASEPPQRRYPPQPSMRREGTTDYDVPVDVNTKVQAFTQESGPLESIGITLEESS